MADRYIGEGAAAVVQVLESLRWISRYIDNKTEGGIVQGIVELGTHSKRLARTSCGPCLGYTQPRNMSDQSVDQPINQSIVHTHAMSPFLTVCHDRKGQKHATDEDRLTKHGSSVVSQCVLGSKNTRAGNRQPAD